MESQCSFMIRFSGRIYAVCTEQDNVSDLVGAEGLVGEQPWCTRPDAHVSGRRIGEQ